MKILHHHLRTTVITMTALVVVILIGLQIFIGFMNEIPTIGRGNYGVWQAFVFVITAVPFEVYPFFPAAALIGCLIGLGRLATASELIVMRASGVSKTQITVSIMRAAVLMLIFVTLIGEWASPMLKDFADNYKLQAQTGQAASQIRAGIWLRDGENFLHIEQILPTGKLQGVIRYQFSQQRLLTASHADSADYQHNHWLFNNVTQTDFQTTPIAINTFRQQIWAVSFDPQLVATPNDRIEQTSLGRLHHIISYLHASGLSATNYEFSFWQRLLQPLATLVMIGLGIPFIFGSLRTVTMGLRIVIGVVIGFGFYTLNQFLGPFSLVYQVPPIWAAVLPVVVFGLIDVFLLWRSP